jgi:hypothetical protein
MAMSIEDWKNAIENWKNLAAAAQSVATIISFGVGGFWVYRRYIRQQEKYPHIEFSADVQFIGVQDDWCITELTATVENKGKVQHRMSDFGFDLNAIEKGAPVLTSARWGGQADFPKCVAKGSFLPAHFDFFFLDPGLKAKYSYIARVPTSATFVILHCWFEYGDKRKFGHTAERTVAVPKECASASLPAIPDQYQPGEH